MSEMGKLMRGGKKKRRRRKKLPSRTAKLTSTKAREILRHGSVRGHKLTKRQRGFMGAVAGRGGK